MLRVAHIDDETADRVLFSSMCKKAGVECVSFSCLDDFMQQKNDFGAVFTDLNLSDYYQIEVIEEVKKRGFPVCVLSGLGGNDIDLIKQVYIDAGAMDFISKGVFFRDCNGEYYLRGLSS